MRSRSSFVGVLVAVAVVASFAGWWASGQVRSPAQVAADAEPPPLSDLTAEVHEERLTESVVFRGTVDLGTPLTVSPSATGVVTGVHVKVGESVRPGRLLLEINDRPLIALPGAVPLWRDLTEGDTGSDVARFRTALAAAGYPTSDREGHYGSSTAAAVRELYAAVGAEPRSAETGDSSEAPADDTDETPAHPDSAAGRATPVQTVKASEIAMISVLPARVAAVAPTLGSTEGGAITLTSRDPVVIAKVNPLDAEKLTVGEVVQATSDSRVGSFRGVISSISAPVQEEEAGYLSTVEIEPRRRLPLKSSGQEVKLTATTVSKQVSLVVPNSAIYSRQDGGSYVVVLEGGRRKVSVNVTAEANGRASVTAARGGLRPGDRVLIGVR